MSLGDRFSAMWFKMVHGHNLVYNTCWEDPRLDRVALELAPTDNVMVITSAGCNALDYALQNPENVYAVDMNPRQNALLDLKIAGIRKLDFPTFFQMFGEGKLPNCQEVYQTQLRDELPAGSRKYWDKKIDYFDRRSFYFCGTAGKFAKLINFYIDRIAKVRGQVTEILAADSIEEQRKIYDGSIKDAFWTRPLRWAVGRDTTLSLVGVPRPQRQHIERDYEGGIAKFIEDCIESVFAGLPLKDNYFWRVYLTGQYTPDCCPEYLREENFNRLKDGLINRVHTYTGSVIDFLAQHETPISRFVLLDHMDWLSANGKPILAREWQMITDRAAPGARVLWRSGGLHSRFVDEIEVETKGKKERVGNLLNYHTDLANELHAKDRVHTYGSFFIADLAVAT